MTFTTRPQLVGTFGMVASTHWLASSVGMAMLERGGNAFDAAVAAGFMLHVCEPHLNGPGGDLPALFHAVSEGRVRTLCAQGVAPRAATLEHYNSLDLDLVPGTGLLATVVPGAVDGWLLLLREYGTLRLSDVLEPAIRYLERGCPLLERARQTIADAAAFFTEHWPTSAALWLPYASGTGPQGETYVNPALAQTYRRLIAAGSDRKGREAEIEAARKAWSSGFVAEAIGDFLRTTEIMDVSGRRHRGVLTAGDMAGWQASFEDPVTYEWGRYTLCKPGPWSQGPVFLQQLALLKDYPIAKLDPVGPDFVHLVVEAAKLAFADREGFYGDPDFVEVPLDRLLSDSYAADRRRLISDKASLELRPGTVGGRAGWVDRAAVRRGLAGSSPAPGMGFGEPTIASRSKTGTVAGDTCHVDVADQWGNMVSATPSGGWLQSSPAIPALGFCLNTRAQMFYLDSSSPASLQPGKRPRTTLSPCFALRDLRPYMAFGTPGGDQQDQWALQLFLRHAAHGMNLQEAIDTPAFTSEHWPSSFWPRAARPNRLLLEGRFPAATIRELQRRGHDIEVSPDWSLSRLSAVTREGDILRAGANPRGMQGYATGR